MQGQRGEAEMELSGDAPREPAAKDREPAAKESAPSRPSSKLRHNRRSPLSPDIVQAETVAQEAVGQMTMQTELGASALRSVAKMKSLLVKRKAPTGKRRKSSGLNAPKMMSPQLKRQLLPIVNSPPIHLTSPSVRGAGLPPVVPEGSSSSSQSLPQDLKKEGNEGAWWIKILQSLFFYLLQLILVLGLLSVILKNGDLMLIC